ncbi:tyrosine-type recombinase/integrase [Algivirga pacifica]|uniref:Tyrosine recombinase XerC n=1 Tax=Algivirga pacifica TaxID=1162670 RepID=A0ABP9DMW3_9BACT
MKNENMIHHFLTYIQYEKRLSKHTIKSYENDLKQLSEFLENHLSGLLPEKASYQDLRGWVLNLLEQEYSTASVNRKVACVRAFYKYLLKQKEITEDPTAKLRNLKMPKRVPSFVKEEEMQVSSVVETTTRTFAELRDQMVIELLYGTGIRLSELLDLKVTDYQVTQGTIKVTGKGMKQRIIPCNRILSEYFSIYLKERGDLEHSYLIVTDKLAPAYPMLIQRIVKKHLLQVSQVEKKSPHVLRHTFATHMLHRGADLNDIKELLGHANLSATQVYTHHSLDQLKKSYKKAHPKSIENE